MVELEEVEDPELEAPQPGPSSIDDDENSDDYSDTGRSISSFSSSFSLSLPPFLPSLLPSKALHLYIYILVYTYIYSPILRIKKLALIHSIYIYKANPCPSFYFWVKQTLRYLHPLSRPRCHLRLYRSEYTR